MINLHTTHTTKIELKLLFLFTQESATLAGLWGSSSQTSNPKAESEASPSYVDTFPPAVSQSSVGHTRQAEEENSFGWGASTSNTAKYIKLSTSTSDNAVY